MRRICLATLAALVISVCSLFSSSPALAGGEAHPLIRRALNALQAARTDLQNAAHDYCGHRVEALEATNSAIEQLQKALDCADNRSSTTEFVIDPVSSAPAPQRHPNINKAISALGAAEGDLQNAARDYCGHRAKALEATRAALNQLRLAVECNK